MPIVTLHGCSPEPLGNPPTQDANLQTLVPSETSERKVRAEPRFDKGMFPV